MEPEARNDEMAFMGSITSILLLALVHDLFAVGRGFGFGLMKPKRDLVGSSSGRAIARAIA